MGSPVGLTSARARDLLAEHGPNTIARTSARGRLATLLGPVADPMVLLLLVASPVYLWVGETSDGIIALAAVVPIVAISWYLQAKAARGVAALARLGTPTATVVRDGAVVEIPAANVVVGDVIQLREGDIVAADSTISETTRISLNESALTGESMPVDKGVGDVVSAGTFVTAGSALAEVTATGGASALGRISQLMLDTTPPRTPLQRAMSRLVVRIALVAAMATVVVIGLELWRGRGWSAALIAGISLLIAAVPEEFSMVYALYLSIGAWYLAQHKALVRTLPSAEALGSVTVICTDKTGTVTEGRLRVAAVHAVTDAARVTRVALLASQESGHDPLDAAIARHAQTQAIDAAAAHGGELVDDWPFADSRVTRVWRHEGSRVQVACKGSLEALLAITHANPTLRAELEEANSRMASAGLRVIAVASAEVGAATGSRSGDEESLAIDGLIGFEDPLRLGVADAVAECTAAGIRVIMVTGDHPATAGAIAREMSPAMTQVCTGDELTRADAAQRDDLVRTASVFARTTPAQKHALVGALQHSGAVVAMTGDGVNDAPALRAADVGVAMGDRGTPVARDAAALVLLDDNFATIVSAVRNGRRIYDNLGRAFRYLIAVHMPIIVSAALVPIVDWPLLLQPAQLVLLEVLLHPIVSLVFQSDPAEPDAMHRPPRRADHALTWNALRPAVTLGAWLSLGMLLVYGGALGAGWPVDECRSLAFATLLLAQPVLLVVLRPAGARRQRTTMSREFLTACAACIGMAIAASTFPPLAALNHFSPAPVAGWVAATVVAAACVLLPAAARRRVR